MWTGEMENTVGRSLAAPSCQISTLEGVAAHSPDDILTKSVQKVKILMSNVGVYVGCHSLMPTTHIRHSTKWGVLISI